MNFVLIWSNFCMGGEFFLTNFTVSCQQVCKYLSKILFLCSKAAPAFGFVQE